MNQENLRDKNKECFSGCYNTPVHLNTYEGSIAFTVTKIMYRYYAVYYKRQDSSSIHTCLSNYGCSWRHAHYRVTLNLTYQNLTISPVEKSSGRLFILLERELIEKTYVIITPVSI